MVQAVGSPAGHCGKEKKEGSMMTQLMPFQECEAPEWGGPSRVRFEWDGERSTVVVACDDGRLTIKAEPQVYGSDLVRSFGRRNKLAGSYVVGLSVGRTAVELGVCGVCGGLIACGKSEVEHVGPVEPTADEAALVGRYVERECTIDCHGWFGCKLGRWLVWADSSTYGGMVAAGLFEMGVG